MNTIISDADLRAIQNAAQKNKNDSRFFKKLLRKKKVVQDEHVPKHTVRLNSLVVLWHSILRKVVKIRIVLPGEADLKQKNISVFAPISMAIFGSRENDSIHMNIGGFKKELKIIKVISSRAQ